MNIILRNLILPMVFFNLTLAVGQVSVTPVLVIHGGAGNISRENISAEQQQQYEAKMAEALMAGYGILEAGGSSSEAVIVALEILENSPLFNAGVGAVLTKEGKIELDASIMEGNGLNAGAVAGVTTIKSPIRAAYEVMVSSEHVMLIGKGAEQFAEKQGLEMVETSYFQTERRQNQWKKLNDGKDSKGDLSDLDDVRKFGTVGAVALDREGNLAAGTSTGGIMNKMYGRVGDSPIIGAGTYADNRTCAVSATGAGEYFIRLTIARDIAAQMEYSGLDIAESVRREIHEKLPALGGDGGVIALDAKGNFTMQFNTKGMFRGYIDGKKKPVIKMFEE